jgi:excisionase family DNA binding protein
MSRGMVTVSQVAQILGVHPNTVRNWSDSGLLKTYRLGYRRDRRFLMEDVSRLLTLEQSQTQEAGEEKQLTKQSRILGKVLKD